jgi:hypothetical protein
LLQVVADLVGEVKDLGLDSELDEVVGEVPLAKFLVSSLAGLGVSNTAINSILVRMPPHAHAFACTTTCPQKIRIHA